jgi:hypothetical protein
MYVSETWLNNITTWPVVVVLFWQSYPLERVLEGSGLS